VRDHGPGIPDEFKARVFEKFVQLTPPMRVEGGAGLGLSNREAANDPARGD